MGVIDVEGGNFDTEVLKATEPVMVVFRAPWCGFCQLMGRVVEEIARDFWGRLKVVRVNVDSDRSLAVQYEVFGIPEAIIFRDGEVVKRVMGYKDKQELASIINQAITQA